MIKRKNKKGKGRVSRWTLDNLPENHLNRGHNKSSLTAGLAPVEDI